MNDLPDYTIDEYQFKERFAKRVATVKLHTAGRQYVIEITEYLDSYNCPRNPSKATQEYFNSFSAARERLTCVLYDNYGKFNRWVSRSYLDIKTINSRLAIEDPDFAHRRLLENIKNGIRRIDFNL